MPLTDISTFACTGYLTNSVPRRIPHLRMERHLISNSNLSRVIFHSWWACENEFDTVSILNFVASKLQPIYFFKLRFTLGKCIDLPGKPSALLNHRVTESFASSCDHSVPAMSVCWTYWRCFPAPVEDLTINIPKSTKTMQCVCYF